MACTSHFWAAESFRTYQPSLEKETLFVGRSWKASPADASRDSGIMVSQVSLKDSIAILRETHYSQSKITDLEIFLASVFLCLNVGMDYNCDLAEV